MTGQELIDYGVSVGWLTPEKAEELKNLLEPEIVRCKDCKYCGTWQCWQYFIGRKTEDDYYCADGKCKKGQ